MKKHIALTLGMAMILTACSSGTNEAAPPEAPAPSPSQPVTVTPSTTPTQAPTTAPPTPSTAPTTPAPATPPPAPTQEATPAPTTPVAPPPANTQTSPRGNLIKQVGELAGIRDANGEYLVSFTVNDIIVDIPCTDPSAEPSEHGHFVAVDVSVETSPNMLNSDLIEQFSMSSLTFQAIGPDGVTSNAGTDSFATLFCLDDAAELPANIGPGETARGFVLLDVEHPAGTLIYEDYWTDSAWEYTY